MLSPQKRMSILSLALCTALAWGDDPTSPPLNDQDTSTEQTTPTSSSSAPKKGNKANTTPVSPQAPKKVNKANAAPVSPPAPEKVNKADTSPLPPSPPPPPGPISLLILSNPNEQIYASSKSFLIDTTSHIREAALNRLQSTLNKPEENNAWGQVYGEWSRYQGGNKAQLNARQAGVLLGLENKIGEWRIGALAGYGRSKLNIDGLNADSAINSYHLGLYAGTTMNKINLRLGGAYAWNKADTTRHVQVGIQTSKNEANYHADTMQLFGELGYQMNVSPSMEIEPVVSVAHVEFKNRGFQESGNLETLSADSARSHVTFSNVGMRVQKTFLANNVEGLLQGGIQWRHAYGDVNPVARLSFVGNSSISEIEGTPITKDAAIINLGVKMKVAKDANIALSYNGLIAHDNKRNSVLAKFIWDL